MVQLLRYGINTIHYLSENIRILLVQRLSLLGYVHFIIGSVIHDISKHYIIKMMETVYAWAQYNVPEDNFQQHYCDNLRSRNFYLMLVT
jgi:hypothetical protein